jgi:tape measure domain-containing protein
MADNRGFQAVVNSVERLRESVNSFGDRQLDLTRVVREELRTQTGYLDRILKSVQAKLDKLNSPSIKLPSKLEIKNLIIEAGDVKLSAKSVVVQGSKARKTKSSLTAKGLAKELSKIEFKTKTNPIGQLISGALLGVGGGFGLDFSKGFQKALKKKVGLNAQDVGYGAASVAIDPKAAIKEAVVARRKAVLTRNSAKMVRDLLDGKDDKVEQEKARYKSETEKIPSQYGNINQVSAALKNAEKIHKQRLAEIEKEYSEYSGKAAKDGKPIVIGVGGFGGTGGRGGIQVKKDLQQVLGRKTANIDTIDNPETDPDFQKLQELIPDIVKNNEEAYAVIFPALAQSNIALNQVKTWAKGYNADAIKLAAKVVALKEQNPDAQIDLVGYSGGGFTVEEALAILKEMGIEDVKGVGVGTPNLGTGYEGNKNYKRVVGKKDVFMKTALTRGWEEDQANTKDIENFSDTTTHGFRQYMGNPAVIKGLSKELGLKAVEHQIDRHLEWLLKEVQTLQDLFTKAATSKQKGQIKAKALDIVNTEAKEIQDYLNNFSQEFPDEVQGFSEAMAGLLGQVEGFFTEQEQAVIAVDVPSAQKAEASLSDKYVAFLNNIIETAKAQAENQIKTLVPNYSSLNIRQKQEFATQFIVDIKKQAESFRRAVQQGDKKLASELGEKILKDSQAIKKIYDELLDNLPDDYTGKRSLQGSRTYLSSVEKEVIQGQKGKGRSQQGLTQILAESQGMSDDVSKGFISGIEDKLSDIESSGIALGEAAIRGAKDALKIASPSKAFFDIGLDVVAGFDDALEGLGAGPGEQVANFVRETDRKVAGLIDTVREKVGNFFNFLGEKFPILAKLKDSIIGIAAGILLSKGLEMFVGSVTQLADASFDAVLQLETMERTLSALTGSSREGAKGLAFVRAEAQRLGLELKGAEEAYAGFKATTQYTSLRGAQADRIFSTFSQTAALRGLSNEQQGRFFEAINQSLSKEKLSAEEVTGQLGEISALNFKQTLARAIGTDGAQLEKLMKQGIATADILPKIAAQYEAENAAIAGSSDTTAQALTRYNNSLLLLQRSFKDWVTGSKIFFNAAAGGIEALTVAIPPLIKVVGNLIVTMGLEQSGGLLTSFLKSATAMAALRSGLAGLLSALQSALPVVGAFLAKFLLVSLAIESVSNALSLMSNAFPELQKNIEQTTVRANALKTALESVGKAAPKATTDALPSDRNQVTTDKTLNLFGMQTSLNLEPVRKFLGFTTRGNKELSDFQAGIGDLVQGVDKTLFRETEVKKVLGDVKELDKQLTVIRSRRFNIAAGDRTAYNASLEQEAKVLEQRDKLLKATSAFQQNLEADSSTVKEQIKALDELVARKGITQSAEASIRATLNQRLEDIDKTKSAFDDLVSSLAKSVNALELALRSLNEQAAYFNETLDRTTARQKARIITEGLANGQGSQTTDFQLQAIDQSALSSRLEFLQKQFQTVNGLLARPDFESIANELKSQAQQLGLNLENTATLDRLIGEGRSSQETQVLEAIKQQLQLKTQIATTQEQVAQGSQGLQNGFLDLSKAVQDYFFNLQQQIKEAQNEIEKIISQLRYGKLKSMLQRALVPGADTFVNGLISQIQGIFDQAASITEQILGQQGARIAFGGEKRGLEQELQNFTRTLGGATEALIRFTQGLLGGSQSGGFSQATPSGSSTSKQKALINAANKLGLKPQELAAIISFETGGTFNPNIVGGAGNKYRGLIQFGPSEQKQFGVTPGQSFESQLDSVVNFLLARGFKSGMGQLKAYATVLTGNPSGDISIKDKFGNSAYSVFQNQIASGKQHYQNAERFLSGATNQAQLTNSLINKGIAAASKFNTQANMCAASVKAFTDAVGINTKAMDLTADSAKKVGQVMTDFTKIQPGDLIGWSGTSRFGDEHIGVYLGGKKVFHQSGSRGKKPGVYDDLDLFKKQQGAYFVRPNSPIPQQITQSVTNTQAQNLTQSLINAKGTQINLGDSAVKQQVSDFILNLVQAREAINRQLADNIRQTQQSVLDAQNQFKDIKVQYSSQTQSSQLTQELRGVDTQFKTFDTQLSDQQRNFQDNIKGLDNLLGQVNPIINLLRQSGSEVDQQSAQFLQGLGSGIEQDKKTYQGYLDQITKIREQLKSGKLEAQAFVEAQAQLRTLESDLERIGQELSVAQGQQNIDKEKQIALLQAQRQLELDIYKTSQQFADNPQELQRRLSILRQEYELKRKQIEFTEAQGKLTKEIDLVTQSLTEAQTTNNQEKIKELRLLQEQKQLELDILQVKNQYPTEEQQPRIDLRQRQGELNQRQIEGDYQSGLLQRQRDLRDLNSQIQENRASLEPNPFTAEEIRRRNARENEILRFQEQQNSIKNQYVGDPERATELITKAGEAHAQTLQLIDRQYQTLGNTVTEGLTGAFSGFFNALVNGDNALQAFGKSLLNTLADIGGNLLQTGLKSVLGGMFKFKYGGEVPYFADGGAVGFLGAIDKSMKAEGKNAILSVLHSGEQVLSDYTGEAQIYRKLEDRLGKNPLNKIPIFAYGGAVGDSLLNNLPSGNSFKMGYRENNQSTTNNDYRNTTVNINVTSPDVGGFNRSERQLGRMAAEYIKRGQ